MRRGGKEFLFGRFIVVVVFLLQGRGEIINQFLVFDPLLSLSLCVCDLELREEGKQQPNKRKEKKHENDSS